MWVNINYQLHTVSYHYHSSCHMPGLTQKLRAWCWWALGVSHFSQRDGNGKERAGAWRQVLLEKVRTDQNRVLKTSAKNTYLSLYWGHFQNVICTTVIFLHLWYNPTNWSLALVSWVLSIIKLLKAVLNSYSQLRLNCIAAWSLVFWIMLSLI